ncbi:FtsX-like permease family protein [Pseudogemmatithrix spongiicola]|uniref:FtsX-like permease family protein n=1 Tax=Pseudogemmatithrix spongiicola TaxID=3062599 RepID=A0AA49JWB4_9BACT|nr:FtsX-like permease family protein [Gemmatimonadaceae bacterium 'strain 138']WKW16123.1 FtsX-like permease family protein [Gemmatimonadaceae bacterium 'strain 318']
MMARRRWALLVTALALGSGGAQAQAPWRSITIDERLAARTSLAVGDTAVLAAAAGAPGDTVLIAGITRRTADPSEIARSEYRVRLHLDHLQALTGAGDRVGRFAVQTRDVPGAVDSAAARINALAFGFRAYPAAEVAVETSATFRVVNRFHRAIGVITIVASAIFLLCITLLKVDERRRDVGALRLLGVSRTTIVRAVVLEASLIAVIGSAMGAALGYGAGWIVNWHYQGVYSTPLKFAIVTPGIVLFATALSLGLGVIAGLLAAQRLVRRAPLDLVGR